MDLCHVIAQLECAHCHGKQLVQFLVKQEKLKCLKTIEDMAKATEQDRAIAN